jgi:undecaprenyl-diphosphatase
MHRADQVIPRRVRAVTMGVVSDAPAGSGPGRRAPRIPTGRAAWLLTLVGAATFLAAALLVHSEATRLDERLFLFFNDVPSRLADVLTPVSKLFLPAALFATIAVAAVFVTAWNRSPVPLAVGACAAAVAYLLANLAKAAAERPRPYEVVADAVLRQPPAHGTSFPSSHTAVAVATVVALLPFLPRAISPWLIAYAALVAWSRMFLGVHYPLDVIGGAVLGVLVVRALRLLPAIRRRLPPAQRAS